MEKLISIPPEYLKKNVDEFYVDKSDGYSTKHRALVYKKWLINKDVIDKFFDYSTLIFGVPIEHTKKILDHYLFLEGSAFADKFFRSNSVADPCFFELFKSYADDGKCIINWNGKVHLLLRKFLVDTPVFEFNCLYDIFNDDVPYTALNWFLENKEKLSISKENVTRIETVVNFIKVFYPDYYTGDHTGD